jgi:hypothetical protein
MNTMKRLVCSAALAAALTLGSTAAAEARPVHRGYHAVATCDIYHPLGCLGMPTPPSGGVCDIYHPRACLGVD